MLIVFLFVAFVIQFSKFSSFITSRFSPRCDGLYGGHIWTVVLALLNLSPSPFRCAFLFLGVLGGHIWTVVLALLNLSPSPFRCAFLFLGVLGGHKWTRTIDLTLIRRAL